MKKAFGVIICILIGIGILYLASISNMLSCSHKVNLCQIQTKSFGYVINETKFSPNRYKNMICEDKKQPGRGGGAPKSFYILTFNLKDESSYSLGSFKNYTSCKESKAAIEDFFNNKKQEFSYVSGAGVTNSFGYILGIIMLVVAYIIATAKPEEKHYDWEDEEENDNPKNDKNESNQN